MIGGLAVLGLALLLLTAVPSRAGASESTLFNVGGRGWGHGIGMSQYGAYGYAKHGWTYKPILRHYYTGISFGKTSWSCPAFADSSRLATASPHEVAVAAASS